MCARLAGSPFRAIGAPVPLIPAQAGIQTESTRAMVRIAGPRLRGDEQTRQSAYACELAPRPSAAWAAANRAIGTRNGEQET